MTVAHVIATTAVFVGLLFAGVCITFALRAVFDFAERTNRHWIGYAMLVGVLALLWVALFATGFSPQ